MKSHNTSKIFKSGILLAAFLLLGAFLAPQAQAQFLYKWLAAGSFQDIISSGGGVDESGTHGYIYPGLYDGRSQIRSKGLWIHTKNWDAGATETPTKVYDVKGAHRGPREPGYGQLFGVNLTLYAKYQPTVVTVNGLQSFNRPVQVDEVDPNMAADQMMYNKVNTNIGLTMERWIRQFSNEAHDNYNIIEYTFTNTGNVDADDQIELPDQDLEAVRISWLNRFSTGTFGPGGTSWGRNTMNDIVGDGNKDYSGDLYPDLRASYSWQGNQPSGFGDPWNEIGGPLLTRSPADTVGRLSNAQFIGVATLHADAAYDDESDDPDQPTTNNMIDSDNDLLGSIDEYNEVAMGRAYDEVDAGDVYPFHADNVEPPPAANAADPDNPGTFDPVEWADRFAHQSHSPDYITLGGFQSIISYGPYDIPFGESIHIVQVVGSDGLSWEACYAIGAEYKRLHNTVGDPEAAEDEDITYNGESMPKNYWVMTGRDSLLDMFDLARQVYENGYDVPEPPQPPATFDVNTSPNQVSLAWTNQDGQPDPDYWIIWRARSSVDSFHVPIDTLAGSVHEYADESAQRGIDYYYYLQAMNAFTPGDDPYGVTGNWIKSNRYYTQTYAPAQLKRDAGTELSAIRVVPNPYNLASEESVRWPDRQDKVGFLNVPGQCSIKIYTESGELVSTLDHSDGSGDEYWGLTTTSNQVVVSGIYFAVIKNTETGNQIIKKFTIIR